MKHIPRNWSFLSLSSNADALLWDLLASNEHWYSFNWKKCSLCCICFPQVLYLSPFTFRWLLWAAFWYEYEHALEQHLVGTHLHFAWYSRTLDFPLLVCRAPPYPTIWFSLHCFTFKHGEQLLFKLYPWFLKAECLTCFSEPNQEGVLMLLVSGQSSLTTPDIYPMSSVVKNDIFPNINVIRNENQVLHTPGRKEAHKKVFSFQYVRSKSKLSPKK